MANSNAATKALNRLLKGQIINASEMDQHFKELVGTNDRLVAVVCGSLVERALQGLLEAIMPNGPGTLFEPNPALSTFSAKINVAYSLNLISSDIKKTRIIFAKFVTSSLIESHQQVFEHRK